MRPLKRRRPPDLSEPAQPAPARAAVDAERKAVERHLRKALSDTAANVGETPATVDDEDEAEEPFVVPAVAAIAPRSPSERRAVELERLEHLEREVAQLEAALRGATDATTARRLQRKIERRETEGNAILAGLSEPSAPGWPTTSDESPCKYFGVSCRNYISRRQRYADAGRCQACLAAATHQPEGS